MEKLIVIILCLPLFCNGQASDQTLQPHARGEAVVGATMEKIRSKCILIDDKHLMTRIAAYATDFGKNSLPNSGGIWKVNDGVLKAVQFSCKSKMRQVCNNILQGFSFDITKATIAQLDVPLYSALVMDTYISLAAGKAVPASKSNQADFWIRFIEPKGDKKTFLAKSEIKASCSDAKMELVFAIDASGSVGSINFNKTLTFLENVVQDLTIAPEKTRVAVIRYSSKAGIIFNLDTFKDGADIIDGINKIRYTGGGTATSLAIDLARTVAFKKARKNVPKVFVLITDGHSNNRQMTVNAAFRLKNETTTIFTIGVGNVNPYEMLAVASNPACTHFFSLSSYNEIDAIIHEIQRVSCEVPLSLDMTSINGDGNGNGTENGPETGVDGNTIPKNDTKIQNIDIKDNINNNTNINNTNPRNTTTVKVAVICGIVHIYASNDYNKPSEALYTYTTVATDGSPGWIRSPATQRLFISLVSKRRSDMSESECTNSHYNITINPKDEGGVTVVCRENGKERECTPNDIRISFGPLCDGDDNVPNPCTKANILNNKMRFKHPKSSNKYIQCKLTGQMEIVKCPKGTQYDESQGVCDPKVTGPSPANGLYKGQNPCTKQAIMNGQFYFANPSDTSSFIQCNEWGVAFLVNCRNNTVWSQQAYTCVHQSSAVTSTFNPCKPSTNNHPQTYKNPKDRKSFIICDNNGVAHVVQCPLGTVWLQAKLKCVHDSIKLGLMNQDTTPIASFVTPSTPKAPTKCTYGEYLPHKDPHKYYVCEWNNGLTEMPCPSGLVWSQAGKVCTWPSASS